MLKLAMLLIVALAARETTAINCYICSGEECNSPNKTAHHYEGCSSCTVTVHYDITVKGNAVSVFNRGAVDKSNYVRGGIGCTNRIIYTTTNNNNQPAPTSEPVWAAWSMPVWSQWTRERETCGGGQRAFCSWSDDESKFYVTQKNERGEATGKFKTCVCYTDDCNLQDDHGDGEGIECYACATGECSTKTKTYTNNCDQCFKVEVYNAKTGVATASKNCVRRNECEVVRKRSGCDTYEYHDEEVISCYCENDKCNGASATTALSLSALLALAWLALVR